MAHILIVEDSRTQAEALRLLLEHSEYEVTSAPDGETALELARDGTFDLVISDITMPGISGYEVCRQIKTVLRRKNLPVLLLTALSDPMDIVQGLEVGADSYVTKPYQPGQLLARVDHILKNRELRRSSPARVGVNVTFLGSTFTINSEKEQILDLLISTFEDAVIQNRQLKQREEELQAAKLQLSRYADTLEERLRSIMESVPDVLFSLTVDGSRLQYVSPASTQVLGFSPARLAEDIVQWSASIVPEDQARVQGELERAVSTRTSTTFEYRLHHPDGTIRWINTTLIPALDQRGEVARVDGLARDVTQRIQLEQQVRQAQKLEAVGTLAGGVAHDFNNVLAAIRASVELSLLDLPKNDGLRSELQEIGGMVDRGAGLTRQLLAFSRRQVLEAQPLDLTALVKHTLKMLERIIGADLHLILQPSSEACTVLADPGQLEQVLMNLCVNARDAMPDGGDLALQTERVSIDDDFCLLHTWARPGEFVCLTVADSGIGMSAETQARIFEPFFTTKELGRGTGLGLSVVYGIIRQHEGMINVYSEPGRGTTFRIYLPFVDRAATPRQREPAGELVGGSETLLLAEDDRVLRNATAKLLARLGYRIIPVATGREALDTLVALENQVDLAILDVVMPEMSGRAVFDAVRDRFANLRFVFTTGYSPAGLNLGGLQSLAVEVLHKPYSFTDLARAVRRALEARAA